MYSYEIGDPSSQTDEDAMKWLEGYPESALALYNLYRGEGYRLDVVEAFKRTLEACIPETLKAKE